MAAGVILRDVSWAITTLLEIVLLGLLIHRKLYRSYPAFSVYLVFIILQSIFLALTYYYRGQGSRSSYFLAWGSQGVVICARWFAVVEIAKKALAEYTGIWAMVSRLLLTVGIGVVVYSVVSSGSLSTLVILTGDRALELCIATIIVGMFVFVRYYHVPMAPLERFLAIGFCLYSCFAVINLCIYEKWLAASGPLWGYLDILTFLATLAVWTNAVYRYSPVAKAVPEPAVRTELYGELSKKLNSQLQLLNNRLDQLFRSWGSRP
jgi:hypothetical protein